jgi:hypothetical protein
LLISNKEEIMSVHLPAGVSADHFTFSSALNNRHVKEVEMQRTLVPSKGFSNSRNVGAAVGSKKTAEVAKKRQSENKDNQPTQNLINRVSVRSNVQEKLPIGVTVVRAPNGSFVQVSEGNFGKRYVICNGVVYGAIKEVSYSSYGFTLFGRSYVDPKSIAEPPSSCTIS